MDDRVVNIGMVGLRFGGQIIRHLSSSPAASRLFRVAAVCDVDAERSESFGRELDVPSHTSLDDLLADPEIPVIGLYTGPAGRADLLRRIIHAGKHVMTTKPFELDPLEARSVLEEARELGLAIHLNSPTPHPSASIHQILDWQRDFNLGRPVSCRGEETASYREAADGSWKDDPDLCPVAPVFRIGIYVINDLVRLFGRISEVHALTSRLFTERPTPDNAQLDVAFCNGALGSVHASFCIDDGQFYSGRLLLHYERGTITRNVSFTPWQSSNTSARLNLVAKDGESSVSIRERVISIAPHENYQWEHLYRIVIGECPLDMPIEETVHGVEVIAAMSQAQRTGLSVPIIGQGA